ncbi:VP5 [St Croix River virus]|uniref:Outer capsid protein VP5 n=1 Tax=St Croix River virus TaxID=104581 RepID=Q9DSP5_9REOV|nr:VP5 [St Croix River virus]AAG34261.1 VP5 [St Croix River virus]
MSSSSRPGFLSRLGSSMARVLTSSKTQDMLKGIGRLASRAASSDIGKRLMEGVATGAITSAVTGANFLESTKQAVIANVAGMDSPPIDPLSRGEITLARKVEHIEEVQLEDERKEALDKWITEKHANDNFAQALKAVGDAKTMLNTEERQITLLERAGEALSTAVQRENASLNKVITALGKESAERTQDENALVAYVSRGISNLQEVVQKEKQTMLAEAVEQTIEISGDIAEHAAASIPVVGEFVASGMATARGAVQLYKLIQLIKELSGLHVNHLTIPHVGQRFLCDFLENIQDVANNPESALMNASERLRHVEELEEEAKHLNQHLIPAVKARALQTSSQHSTQRRGIIPPIPLRQQPLIHIYTSAFGSDYVILFHVIAPYGDGRAFALMVDLEYGRVAYQEVYVYPSAVGPTRYTSSGPPFFSAASRFFRMAASGEQDHSPHAAALRRSVAEDPFYIGSLPYRARYADMMENAYRIANSPIHQAHLMRGPISVQRTAILNALQHGVALVPKNRV